MSEPQRSYPTAKPGEETVRDVLLASTPDKIEPAITAVESLKSTDQNLTRALAPYLLRTSAVESNDKLEAYKYVLEQSTHLSPPELFFSGPKTSQCLLRLADASKHIAGYLIENVGDGDIEIDQHFHRHPLLELIVKHEGQTLNEFLYNGRSFANLSGDALRRSCDNKKAIMQYYLDNPDALHELFEQAAYIGLLPESRQFPDIKPDNLMVDPTTHALSLIDIVAPEDVRPKNTQSDSNKDKAKKYIGNHYCSLHESLSLSLLPDKIDEINLVAHRFEHLLDLCLRKTEQKIENGTIGQDHPEWKGFTKVDDIAAIPLDAPSWVLKDALDKLYAKAVPEQAR